MWNFLKGAGSNPVLAIEKIKFLNKDIKNNLSEEWAHDIVEYLQGYYGKSKNYNKLYKLIKEIVDTGLRAKSFNSFREFLDYRNPKYHETNRVNNYKNLWWCSVAYLLGNTERVKNMISMKPLCTKLLELWIMW